MNVSGACKVKKIFKIDVLGNICSLLTSYGSLVKVQIKMSAGLIA